VNAMQVPLDTSRIHVKDLTPTQVKHILSKIKKQGGHILKAKISPSSSVDCKVKKGGSSVG